MVTVKRPARLFSFTDFAKTSPREPPPGDRLDAQFMELADAIRTTQDALAEIRRDDGELNRIVRREQLDPQLLDEVIGKIAEAVEPVRAVIAHATNTVVETERNIALYARDAEAAVATAQLLVNGMAALRELIQNKSDINAKAAEVADMLADESENWAMYSQAQAENAIAAKDEALAWAEYLAGPVVDSGAAPAYIAGSKFPHGLYYQAVEGGVAGLWSAKWWALQAYNLVGAAGQFFLGPWASPPLPSEQNPSTGQVAPNPIPVGSIYYDTTTSQIMVWDGTAWKQSVGLMSSSVQAHYLYSATAGQQDFTGVDLAGQSPTVGDSPSDVHINGVRLVNGLDYSVDTGTNTLHISSPVTATSIVAWDLLMLPTAPAASIKAWKIKPLTPDGSAQDFPLQYASGASSVDANVSAAAELMVSLDGAMQEPGVDFTASGNSLHMATAPLADSDLWAVWFEPEVQTR